MRLVSLDPAPASASPRALDPREPTAALVLPHGLVPLDVLNRHAGSDWPTTLAELLDTGRFEALAAWVRAAPPALADAPVAPDARPGPLLHHPRKILGVGLNYAEHAGDLGEQRPTEPATFMKPATTIVGPGDEVLVPPESERTTGEAELGLVIGRRARRVAPAEALDAVAGVTTIVDMTAEDILQRNPRFLTRAKSFDTFFSFGPELVTLDEVGELAALEVRTTIDGAVHRANVVANMMFAPAYLVSFFSHVLTLEPGDVISTGTPGAVVLRDGCTVGCVIEGVGSLANPVRDLKLRP
jgi:2-keto-4-pentenoate hydratase/2-oxohepta-3-ene-1,7-dioic acid hydratase in catechol pathway